MRLVEKKALVSRRMVGNTLADLARSQDSRHVLAMNGIPHAKLPHILERVRLKHLLPRQVNIVVIMADILHSTLLESSHDLGADGGGHHTHVRYWSLTVLLSTLETAKRNFERPLSLIRILIVKRYLHACG